MPVMPCHACHPCHVVGIQYRFEKAQLGTPHCSFFAREVETLKLRRAPPPNLRHPVVR